VPNPLDEIAQTLTVGLCDVVNAAALLLEFIEQPSPPFAVGAPDGLLLYVPHPEELLQLQKWTHGRKYVVESANVDPITFVSSNATSSPWKNARSKPLEESEYFVPKPLESVHPHAWGAAFTPTDELLLDATITAEEVTPSPYPVLLGNVDGFEYLVPNPELFVQANAVTNGLLLCAIITALPLREK
jgi:hypothetical protein